MADLEMTRAPGDRRLYTLEGVGTLRLDGWASRAATAEAGGASFGFRRPGILTRRIEATDAAGAVIGSFEGRNVRRGGVVHWNQRALELRPASRRRERYALADGDRALALLDGKGWGKRPVAVSVADPTLEPGLVLFAAFVVRGLAEDADAAAATAST